MTHRVVVVRRPFDQVRPICSCGWLGTTCRNLADANIEATEHAGTDGLTEQLRALDLARLISEDNRGHSVKA